MHQTRFDVGIGELFQILPHRLNGTDGRQTFLGIVVMLLEMFLNQRLQQLLAVFGERIFLDQNVGQRTRLIQHPCMHPFNELIPIHEI